VLKIKKQDEEMIEEYVLAAKTGSGDDIDIRGAPSSSNESTR